MKQDTLEPLVFELSSPGRRGCSLPRIDVPETDLPADMLRENLDLPEVSEVDVVRHPLVQQIIRAYESQNRENNT